jgi:hypothetical protein
MEYTPQVNCLSGFRVPVFDAAIGSLGHYETDSSLALHGVCNLPEVAGML